MDRQTLNKLALMLQGLAYRISDEIDYFISLEGDFKSGAKRFPFSAEPAGKMLDLRFEGRRSQVEPQKLSDVMLEYARRFDAVRMECSFRGETLIRPGPGM